MPVSPVDWAAVEDWAPMKEKKYVTRPADECLESQLPWRLRQKVESLGPARAT